MKSNREKKAATEISPATFPAKVPASVSHVGTSIAVCLFLAAIILAAYAQTFRFDFVNYDDGPYVYENHLVTAGLSVHGIGQAFTGFTSDNWTPLTIISHMADWQFFGPVAGGHHLTNVLFHTLAAMALFLALHQMTGALWRSALVAAVFAVHPLHVESVAWVSERKDVLSGLFFMLTLWAYIRYARRPGSVPRYSMVALFFALGLMSKPVLVTAPFILLLLDYWPLGRFSREAPRKLIVEKLPLLALSVAACFMTWLAENHGHAVRSLAKYSLAMRLENSIVSCVVYVGQMFYPAKLALFYPFPVDGPSAWLVMAAAVVLAGVTVAVFKRRRHHPWLFVSWWWYLIMLVPVIGIVQVGNQSHADRHTYLPQIGLYLALAWGIGEFTAKWRWQRAVPGTLAALIIVAFAGAARVQAAYWKNSITLWSRTLAVTTNNDVAELNLGNALIQTGQSGQAIDHFNQALAINPRLAEANASLGMALRQQGHLDDAIGQLQKALALKPDDADFLNNLGNALVQKGEWGEAIREFQKAVDLQPGDADIHNNLGTAFAQKGDVTGAIAQFQDALTLWPGDAQAHFNLGNAFLQNGNTDAAISQLRAGLAIEPGNAAANNDLAAALFQKGQIDEAIKYFQAALALSPDYFDARINLGNAMLQRGKLDEAATQFEAALDHQPNSAAALDGLSRVAWRLATSSDPSVRNGPRALELAGKTCQLTGGNNPKLDAILAAAYAETGQFPQAIATVQRAMQLAATQNNTALLAALQSQLKLYQAGSPLRDPAP